MTLSLRKKIILPFVIALTFQSVAIADNTDSPYFKGGKLDAYFDRQDNGSFQVNSILWTPVIKGGHGIIVSKTGAKDINYYGGFVRPLLSHPEWGDLILGAQSVVQGNKNQVEVQGEYRLPFGLGFGGGFVDREASSQDVKFAKLSFRNQWQDIHYILSTQWQRYQNQDYAGGYIALYNKSLMATWGSDGEQWRSTFGYIAPDQGEDKLRPAFEVFYVDNSIGKVDGSKDLMVTGSLGFRKGFLGHESRLGRAMGPTGVEFSNPLGYLTPNFNRRQTAWEIGDFANFRFIHKNLANGTREQTLETAIYPLQFLLGHEHLLSALFVGVGHTSPTVGKDGVSGLFGYHKRIGNFESSARVQHDFDRNDTSLFVSIIHWL
jgi:hypothetical protein